MDVSVPCPISDWLLVMVTIPSLSIWIHTLSANGPDCAAAPPRPPPGR